MPIFEQPVDPDQDERNPDAPYRSIWDEENDEDQDYEYDGKSAEPPSAPQARWFGGQFEEYDETDWEKSARGENPWANPAFRDHYAGASDDRARVKNGFTRTDHLTPGYDRYRKAQKKGEEIMAKYRKVRHPSRALKKHIKRKLDEAGITKAQTHKIFEDRGW